MIGLRTARALRLNSTSKYSPNIGPILAGICHSRAVLTSRTPNASETQPSLSASSPREKDLDKDSGPIPSGLRGMPDYFGEDARKLRFLEDTMRRVAILHGFNEVRTPIVEKLDVFHRSLGESSDVVAKEMFAFPDKFQRMVCLRPEGTAGVMRAVLQHDMLKPSGSQSSSPSSSSPSSAQPVSSPSTPAAAAATVQRLFYCGPMFRYENPQRGRLRQFHQFGVELLGARAAECASAQADIDVLLMAVHVLQDLGLFPAYTTLRLNTLGDSASRASYRQALIDFLEPQKQQLSFQSQQRLERGAVLRILDSKDGTDQLLLKDAPRLSQHLTPAARQRFDAVRQALDWMEIPYEWDEKLVRGLDYYSQTCWEFVENVQPSPAAAVSSESPSVSASVSSASTPKAQSLGASQSAVLAGGRYDVLAQSLGNKTTIPAIGWAAGLERLKLLRESVGLPFPSLEHAARPVAIVVHRTRQVAKRIQAAEKQALTEQQDQTLLEASAAKGKEKKRKNSNANAESTTTTSSSSTLSSPSSPSVSTSSPQEAAEDGEDQRLVRAALRLSHFLRQCHIPVVPLTATGVFSSETSHQMSSASKFNAGAALLLGEAQSDSTPSSSSSSPSGSSPSSPATDLTQPSASTALFDALHTDPTSFQAAESLSAYLGGVRTFAIKNLSTRAQKDGLDWTKLPGELKSVL